MDSKKSNKITEIVRLRQILKKWKKLAANANNSGGGSGSKSIKFLKKTLSFSESSSSSSLNNGALAGDNVVVPKGYLAVCVGEELKRFVIPMEYLGHHAFGILLREAEEEFGFQQEGVLRIPCQVPVFEKILKMMDDKRDSPDAFHLHDFGFSNNTTISNSGEIGDVIHNTSGTTAYSHRHQPPQMCR